MFRKRNINPCKANINDCWARSMAYAMRKSYYSVIGEMAQTIARLASEDDRKVFSWGLNLQGNVQVYLESIGYTMYYIRGSVNTLSKLNKTGKRAIIWCTNHMTALDGRGNYVDTWDCGNKHCKYLFTKDVEVVNALEKYILPEISITRINKRKER